MGTVVQEKRQKGIIYRAEVRRERQRLTKRFSRKTDAWNWVSEVESKIVNGQRIHRQKRYTLGDAIDKYCREILPLKKPGTQKIQRQQLEWFKEKIGSIRLYKLSSSDLSAAREMLRQEPVQRRGQEKETARTGSTLNRYFQPLMHCLRIAREEWNWVHETSRIKKLKENPARTEYYSPVEIKNVLAQIERKALAHLQVNKRKDWNFSQHMNLLIARVALHTGARLTETCALRWQNIDLIEGTIRFPGEDTKTGKGREVPIPDGLKQELIAWKIERDNWKVRFPSEYLFPALRASKKGHRSDFASKVFRTAARELGITGKTFHDIRHTAATWATKQKIPTRTVQALLGHQKISTTERYSHTMSEGQREAVDAIEEMLDEKDERPGPTH